MDSERHDRFAELFVRHQKRLYGYILSLVPNGSDAEELFQQTCLTVWKNWEAYDPERDFARWACGIGHNLVRNFARKHERRQVMLSEHVLDALGEARADHEERLEARRSALASCLGKLPREQREIVVEFYSGGQNVGRISERTGRSANVLYKLLRKIRLALHDCITLALGAGA